MSHQRIILEMGMGNSLYRQDYTTAAVRAVQDALRHSTIAVFGSLGLDSKDMRVVVTIGAQMPDRVDAARVAASLPRGVAEVTVVHGGMNVENPETGVPHVIVTAGVEAFVDVDKANWKLA